MSAKTTNQQLRARIQQLTDEMQATDQAYMGIAERSNAWRREAERSHRVAKNWAGFAGACLVLGVAAGFLLARFT